MIVPWVFDHTALIALFAAHQRAYDLWLLADSGAEPLIFPAAAVAEASHQLGTGDNAWRVLLMAPSVQVSALDESAAISTGRDAGSLVVRHVTYEALAVQGVVVTRAPWQYVPGAVPLRVI